LKRPYVFPLLEKSVQLGLPTTVAPSATPLLTENAIEPLQHCGIARMAVSPDGPDAESHDGFRRATGSFDRAIRALQHAQQIGLETQVNTTVTRHNVGRDRKVGEGCGCEAVERVLPGCDGVRAGDGGRTAPVRWTAIPGVACGGIGGVAVHQQERLQQVWRQYPRLL
jgi:hypothetical protein